MSESTCLSNCPSSRLLGDSAEGSSPGDTLVWLGRWLTASGYSFVPPTPSTHALVVARPQYAQPSSLRDIFGWSRPFAPQALPPSVFGRMQAAGLLVDLPDGRCKSTVRFACLEGLLFAHSAYPTDHSDAVFFGPDTYRFVSYLQAQLHGQKRIERVLDVGCGAGPGGIALARHLEVRDLVLADINCRALAMARSNAVLAGVRGTAVLSDLFNAVEGRFDCIVANPPYLDDAHARTYRHGGGEGGTGLSVRIVRDSFARLTPGGCLLLYTGAPIVDGVDRFKVQVESLLQSSGRRWTYQELDPDVFGEELASDSYRDVERIAAVGLSVWNSSV